MERIEHQFIDGVESKYCGRCETWVSINGFSKNKVKWDGLQERCTDCRKEHWVQVGKYTKTIPPKHIQKQRHREAVIKSYGINVEYFNSMLIKQNNKCAICQSTDWGRPSPSIDHDHHDNTVRGLLCNTCNRGLGLLKDNIDVLKGAIKYLKEHEERVRQR